MKLTALRRSMSGARAASLIIGALFGLAAAIGTVLLGLLALPQAAATPFYAVLCLLWTLGWLIGPMLTGGDAILRPEYFTLFPLRPRRLAAGLLGAAFAGITPVITAIAFCLLLIYGVQLGVAAALVAVPAIALQLMLVIVLSKLAAQALGSAMRSGRAAGRRRRLAPCPGPPGPAERNRGGGRRADDARHPVAVPAGHCRARARQRACEGARLVSRPAFPGTGPGADLDRVRPGRPDDARLRGGDGVDDQAHAAPCRDCAVKAGREHSRRVKIRRSAFTAG
jgi:hypothetical protein